MPPRLGWIILAVALFVPALIFWDWWTRLDAPQSTLSRRPTSAAVFPSTQVARQLANPLELKGDAPAPAPPPVAATPAAGQEAPPAAPEAKPAPAFDPRIDRDPTLSPMDLQRLIAVLPPPIAPIRTPPVKRRIRPPLPTIQSLVTLQGITATPDSILAIVNEKVVLRGGIVRVVRDGAPAAVKVLDIQPDRVIFQHGTQRWLGTLGN